MSSNPPASIETTMPSNEIPRAALTVSFFSGFQRNGFIVKCYADVCLLSPRLKDEDLKTPSVKVRARAALSRSVPLDCRVGPHVTPFPRLQSKHSVCKFSSMVSPPFDHGKTWSISNTKPATVAGERPQATQQKRSLFNTKNPSKNQKESKGSASASH